MAQSIAEFLSIGGITGTVYKGTSVLSARSNRYTHTRPGGPTDMGFTGARTNLLDAEDNIPLPAGTFVPIEFSNTEFDTDGYFDVSEPSKLIIPPGLGGVFEVGFAYQAVGTADNNNYIQGFVLKNGTDVAVLGVSWMEGAVSGAYCTACALIDLAEGDSIELQAVWSGSGTDAVQTDVNYSPALWLGRWK